MSTVTAKFRTTLYLNDYIKNWLDSFTKGKKRNEFITQALSEKIEGIEKKKAEDAVMEFLNEPFTHKAIKPSEDLLHEIRQEESANLRNCK